MATPAGPHLDDARWAALQRRERAEVEHFARHLAAPCEPCEAFLARLGEAEGGDAGSATLDALADEALAEAGRAAPSEDALGWARLQRRLDAEGVLRRGARRARAVRVAGVLAVAIAASVVFAVLPARMRHAEDTGDGMRIKGAGAVSLELSATARGAAGELSPLGAGAPVGPDAVLLLRYRASDAAEALLVREVPGAAPQVLGRFTLAPGEHALRDEGGLAGVSLAGEVGEVALVLVAPVPAGGAADLRTLEAARRAGAAEARLPLRVEPGETAPR